MFDVFFSFSSWKRWLLMLLRSQRCNGLVRCGSAIRRPKCFMLHVAILCRTARCSAYRSTAARRGSNANSKVSQSCRLRIEQAAAAAMLRRTDGGTIRHWWPTTMRWWWRCTIPTTQRMPIVQRCMSPTWLALRCSSRVFATSSSSPVRFSRHTPTLSSCRASMAYSLRIDSHQTRPVIRACSLSWASIWARLGNSSMFVLIHLLLSAIFSFLLFIVYDWVDRQERCAMIRYCIVVCISSDWHRNMAPFTAHLLLVIQLSSIRIIENCNKYFVIFKVGIWLAQGSWEREREREILLLSTLFKIIIRQCWRVKFYFFHTYLLINSLFFKNRCLGKCYLFFIHEKITNLCWLREEEKPIAERLTTYVSSDAGQHWLVCFNIVIFIKFNI